MNIDLAPPPRRTTASSERRRERLIALAVGLTVFLAGSGIVLTLRARHHRPAAAGAASRQDTLVWSVRMGTEALIAVVASGGGRPPTILAIPGDTAVDLPGGAWRTVGLAGRTPGLLMASVQAVVERRIHHFVVGGTADLARMADRSGGLQVQVEQPFLSGRRRIEPGPVRLSGAQVVDYLDTASRLDRTGRWEDVLTGLFAGQGGPGRAFDGRLGSTDDPAAVAGVLRAARGAPVLELPTAPAVGGGVTADARAIAALLRQRFGPPQGPLVQVVVLNGNGRPGMGGVMASLLAPSGFRVIASQNARTFSVKLTKIVASDSSYLRDADRVRDLLGVGKVYVGTIPSRSADVTILVGRDFRGE